MAGRDYFDYINITISSLSFIAASIAAWFAWKSMQRDRWCLEFLILGIDVERYDTAPPRITYQFSVKNSGLRAVRILDLKIMVSDKPIPLRMTEQQSLIDSGKIVYFNHVSEQWIDIESAVLFDQDGKLWSVEKKLLNSTLLKEKARHKL